MGAPAVQENSRPFGRYRLVEQIGAGGMAVVYRAIADGPEGFTRSFVIKRVLPELSKDPGFAKMLIAEARLSALLHHPNIVQVFELGQVGEEYYLAMEYVEGVDLVTLLNRCIKVQRPIPVGLVCFIIHELAVALAYAHDLRDEEGRPLNIIHRDISPSNVMVTPTGAVKLLDFGIAKAADHVRGDQTRTGKLKGKISYLSPEQAEGEADIDKRADIFSLGILMYECLTMKRLFRSDDDLTTLKMVRAAKVPPPSSVVPTIDAAIDAVALKMLAKNREERYAGGDEVAAALGPIIHGIEVDATSLRKFVTELGPWEKKTKPVDPGSVSRELAEASSQRSASIARAAARKKWIIGGAVGAVVAIGGALPFLLHKKPPPEPVVVAPPEPAKPPPVVETAPPPKPTMVKVPVRTEPPGAKIFVDGAERDITPAVIEVAAPCELQLALDGYKSAKEVVSGPGEIKVKLTRIGHSSSHSSGDPSKKPDAKHKSGGHQSLD